MNVAPNSEKPVSLRAVLSLALITVVAACSSTDGPDSLSVSTTVTPAQFRAGDRVSVHVVVRNTGFQTRTVASNSCPQAFVVLAGNGTISGPREELCTAQAEFVTLRPGEEFSKTEDWSGDALGG